MIEPRPVVDPNVEATHDALQLSWQLPECPVTGFRVTLTKMAAEEDADSAPPPEESAPPPEESAPPPEESAPPPEESAPPPEESPEPEVKLLEAEETGVTFSELEEGVEYTVTIVTLDGERESKVVTIQEKTLILERELLQMRVDIYMYMYMYMFLKYHLNTLRFMLLFCTDQPMPF